MTDKTQPTIEEMQAQIAKLTEALQQQTQQQPKEEPKPKSDLLHKATETVKTQACKNTDEFCTSVAKGLGWGIGLALTLFQ